MRLRPVLFWLAAFALSAGALCPTGPAGASEPTAEVAPTVRVFLDQVALEVTAEGPRVWSRHLSGEPEFYMVVAGRMEFASAADAAAAITKLAGAIAEVELRWGSEVRM